MAVTYDAIVVGAGVICASTAFHLAKRVGLMVKFGVSGHGFKLVPAAGKVKAQTVLG